MQIILDENFPISGEASLFFGNAKIQNFQYKSEVESHKVLKFSRLIRILSKATKEICVEL